MPYYNFFGKTTSGMVGFFGAHSSEDQELIKTISSRIKDREFQATDTDTGLTLDLESYSLIQSIFLTPETRIEQYSIFDYMDDTYSDCSQALELVSDEVIVKDPEDHTPFKISCEDQKLREFLEVLLYDTLNLRDGTYLNIIARNLCKYGDSFQEKVFDSLRGITKIKELPVKSIYIDFDIQGNILGYRQKFLATAVANPELHFEPWQLYHLKIPSKIVGGIYGRSLLQDAIRPVKQLEAVELAMMLGRINRSVDRYIWKIPVGNRSADDAKRYVTEVKNSLKRKRVINTQNGTFTSVNDILTALEDLYIPVREKGGIEVEYLERKNQAQDSISDVEYWKNKEIAALKMPKQFLSQDEILTDGKALSSTDVRFSRRIQKIQNIIRKFLVDVCKHHIEYAWYGGHADFDVHMSNVSQLEERAALEMKEIRYNLAGTMMNFVPDEFIFTKILKFTDEEAQEIMEEMKNQKRRSIIEDSTNQVIAQMQSEAAGQEYAKKMGLNQSVESEAIREFKQHYHRNPELRRAVENLVDLHKQKRGLEEDKRKLENRNNKTINCSCKPDK